ncbi:MAG: insulinase family protein [Anaerolineales bacterium]|nr:insulinase family protein [Anaerolineales bacterium]MDW8162463.1 pitrilysin family protein [Anaerolineales bacterium]
MSEDITRITLSNGLLVLLKEIHTAPIISHWIWYRVGSRDEPCGKTGISHWIEHMLFKGTPRYPAAVLDKAISREGGVWNAMTYLDWTACFETLPAEKIELALSLEADRMVNCVFDPQEVEAERTVIISERQGNENEPLFRLGEEVQAAAFRVHPYHHEVIGDLVDLQTLTREDLYQHYRTYYVPNNAVLSIAGDFDTEEMLQRVREHYEGIPRGGDPPRLNRIEPPQQGERRVTVEGPDDTTYLLLAHHVPQCTHPDFIPLLILDSLLTGPSNLNLFGGGISNKTSRLYRALVEGDLAVSVYGGVGATVDPFLHMITCIVRPERSAEQVLQRIEEEIRRLQDAPPPLEEIQRAGKQARALFAYGSETISNQAFWMGFSEMFATYEWYLGILEKLAQVTPEDVQRVAQQYFLPRNRVVGVYLPQKVSLSQN